MHAPLYILNDNLLALKNVRICERWSERCPYRDLCPGDQWVPQTSCDFGRLSQPLWPLTGHVGPGSLAGWPGPVTPTPQSADRSPWQL